MAANLVNLVSQLQHMESAFAAVLMEAAFKLSSLTETNVFLLIESPDSRKFGGSPHLCQSYVTSRLVPIGNDVQVSVSDYRPSLTETPLPPPPPPTIPSQPVLPPYATANRFQPSMTAASVNGTSRYPPLSNSIDTSGAPLPSRSVPASPTPKNGRKRSVADDSAIGASPVKSVKMECLPDMKPDVESLNSPPPSMTPSHISSRDASVASPAVSDDSDIICEDEIFAVVNQSGNPPPPLPSSQIDVTGSSNGGRHPPGPWTHHYAELVTEFLQGSAKARALASVDNFDVTDKNSVSFKMLSSTIYDLGRVLGARCQLDSGAAGYREFFDGVVTQFMAAYPNLERSGDAKVECRNRGNTPLKSFLRSRLQQAFSKKNYSQKS